MKYILIFLISINFSFADTIKFGVTPETLNSKHGVFLSKLYIELFNKLGYSVKIVSYPPIRLEKQTKLGDVDGELVREANYNKTHDYLTKVVEPLFSFNVSIYSNNPSLKVKGISDLEGMHIGHRRGMKIVKEKLNRLSIKTTIISYNKMEKLFKLLSLKRIGILIGVEDYIQNRLNENPGYKKSTYKIKRISKESAHMFLGKKYAFLNLEISKKLKEMKKSGE